MLSINLLRSTTLRSTSSSTSKLIINRSWINSYSTATAKEPTPESTTATPTESDPLAEFTAQIEKQNKTIAELKVIILFSSSTND